MIKAKDIYLKSILVTALIFSTGCTGNKDSSSLEIDPCEASAAELATKSSQISEAKDETLRGIRYHTKRKVVLMPVTSKEGSNSTNNYNPFASTSGGAALTGFATEIMNQSVLNEGINTVAWFKVTKELKKVVGNVANYNDPFGSSGQQSVVNDENIPELIKVSKKLGACYIIRPVILSASSITDSKTSMNPLGMYFGGGVSTKTSTNSTVDLKIDIISIREENIIASKTFSGRSVSIDKKRANVLDGITGSSFFGSGTNTDQTKIAFYDTMDKIVDFLASKML